ncbi:Rho termination factor N-terminal domain-containing protein [Microbacterium ureisolvens]|uniref:Rho termination factor N-terminal domain-containing protein n=1 Tax=Microbacterium ureisolvens TaxID=2781186 RepID=A0ABS7HVD7_9MICO|nr:Rho termination factor N-terminal domain-containing protein [Microbacterium ureisolvens]MBW9109075.1 Rho termination factor N-terminal domain-containing protein [Microbacterium ureisolvens]
MAEQPGNQTPDTPDLKESELREMKVDELRAKARDAGVPGAADLNKEELVEAISERERRKGLDEGGGEGADDLGAGPDDGRVRQGPEASRSLDYSQEVTSPDDEPERDGRSLATTHHEVIRQWAEERGGRPATVDGTEHGDHLGVLRFDFGEKTERLREVSWEEWFETFDARRLNFIYQQTRSDGAQSNFFRLDNPEREDG